MFQLSMFGNELALLHFRRLNNLNRDQSVRPPHKLPNSYGLLNQRRFAEPFCAFMPVVSDWGQFRRDLWQKSCRHRLIVFKQLPAAFQIRASQLNQRGLLGQAPCPSSVQYNWLSDLLLREKCLDRGTTIGA